MSQKATCYAVFFTINSMSKEIDRKFIPDSAQNFVFLQMLFPGPFLFGKVVLKNYLTENILTA